MAYTNSLQVTNYKAKACADLFIHIFTQVESTKLYQASVLFAS